MNWTFTSDAIEFRRLRSRVRQSGENKGQTYFILIFEDSEGYQCEVSVNDSSKFEWVHKFQRGELYRVPVVVVATKDYQFARLGDGPMYHITPDGELEQL